MLRRLFGRFHGRPETRRSAQLQQQVDEASRQLTLYHFETCPYCVRVKRALKRLDLQIELRDAHLPVYAQELRLQGGRYQTPCLRIETGESAQWLYESVEIIRYLERRFPRS